ncbi:MAG: type I-F CRISPR-associated endoribonuclease Cas6/Csy4 [Lysobacterales bacterium]
MDHYFDIRLRPDPEFPAYQLMDALFAKLHRVLAEQQRTDIGISFPQVQTRPPKLGEVLRLHGGDAALEALSEGPWMGGMRQMVEIAAIAAAPIVAAHRRVIRVQAKSSPERLRRRLMRRKQISAEEACVQIPDTAAERVNLPFVEIASRSTGQRFRLFLHHGPIQTQPVSGTFNSYGLSQIATIPWF